MKLALGAAQFGMDYGVSNREGATGPAELRKCLALAAANNVCLIDTAPAYGNSEEALGFAKAAALGFGIISKVPKGMEPQRLRASVIRSMERLGCEKLAALLFHSAGDLVGENGDARFREAQSLQEEGLVEKIGASIYSSGEIDSILDRYAVQAMQVPLSILDQRLIQSGHIEKLRQRKIEIHGRSLFLQGLVFLPPTQLHPYFSSIRAHLEKLQKTLAAANISPLRACVQFAAETAKIDVGVCGINNSGQLSELLIAVGAPISHGTLDYSSFSWPDPQILNPSLWMLQGSS